MNISAMGADFNHGIALFNHAHFYDAHEVLEDAWRSIPRDEPLRRHLRLHIQGMVQLAVAFHHQSTGNHVGAHSVLERALRNLHGAENSFPDLDLERLRTDLAPWRRYSMIAGWRWKDGKAACLPRPLCQRSCCAASRGMLARNMADRG